VMNYTLSKAFSLGIEPLSPLVSPAERRLLQYTPLSIVPVPNLALV
jgi:hypothetical protein